MLRWLNYFVALKEHHFRGRQLSCPSGDASWTVKSTATGVIHRLRTGEISLPQSNVNGEYTRYHEGTQGLFEWLLNS